MYIVTKYFKHFFLSFVSISTYIKDLLLLLTKFFRRKGLKDQKFIEKIFYFKKGLKKNQNKVFEAHGSNLSGFSGFLFLFQDFEIVFESFFFLSKNFLKKKKFKKLKKKKFF